MAVVALGVSGPLICETLSLVFDFYRLCVFETSGD